MLDLLYSDLSEPLDRHPTLKKLRLRITLAEVHRVEVVLVVEARLDEPLHPKDGGQVQALQL